MGVWFLFCFLLTIPIIPVRATAIWTLISVLTVGSAAVDALRKRATKEWSSAFQNWHRTIVSIPQQEWFVILRSSSTSHRALLRYFFIEDSSACCVGAVGLGGKLD